MKNHFTSSHVKYHFALLLPLHGLPQRLLELRQPEHLVPGRPQLAPRGHPAQEGVHVPALLPAGVVLHVAAEPVPADGDVLEDEGRGGDGDGLEAHAAVGDVRAAGGEGLGQLGGAGAADAVQGEHGLGELLLSEGLRLPAK